MQPNRIALALLVICLAYAACGSPPPAQVAEVTRIVEVVVTATEPEPTSAQTDTPTPTRTPTQTPTIAPSRTQSQFTPTATVPSGETAIVVNVIDGDTIEVSLNGQIEDVRYIGINTPEYGEPCGDEATAANAELVQGQTVTLVKDVRERDQFDRLLRYVYVDGLFVNAELVAQGYAQAVEYPPDTAHASEFAALEGQAKTARLGCHPTGVFEAQTIQATPAPTQPAATSQPATVAQPTIAPTDVPPTIAPTVPPPPTEAPTQAPQNCDPSYPTVCIPPYPPDLDCGQIGFRRFTVLPPDPHGFDGDNDGVGCESG